MSESAEQDQPKERMSHQEGEELTMSEPDQEMSNHDELHDVQIGDLVSVERWDRTERPVNRIGSPAKVTGIKTGQVSETGTLLTVKGSTGAFLIADKNWFSKYTKPQQEQNEIT